MLATTITDVRFIDVDIPLHTPFGIATGAQVVAENLFVVVTLKDGTLGTGEAAPFPAVNGETRQMVRDALVQVKPDLLGQDAAAWRDLSWAIKETLHATPSARCAVETAVLDALCRHHRFPLTSFFGGVTSVLRSDLTITTGTLDDARTTAARIAREGYDVIKLKVGGVPLDDDVKRLQAVANAAPGLGLIIDANGGMPDVETAQLLLDEAAKAGARVVLFEQPLPRADLDGMAALARCCHVPIGADESASSVRDVVTIAQLRAANVINIKLTKCGVVEGMEMAIVARSHGLGLMVGGMVESRLCTGTSACMAAGMGGFTFIDLDTPLWMVESPVEGGYDQQGPRIDVSGIDMGHGMRLNLERCSRITARG